MWQMIFGHFFLIFAEIAQNQNIKKLMNNSWNFVHIHFDEFFFDKRIRIFIGEIIGALERLFPISILGLKWLLYRSIFVLTILVTSWLQKSN